MEKKGPHMEGFKCLTVLRSELRGFKISKQIYGTRKSKMTNLARYLILYTYISEIFNICEETHT